jgi:hypothetical protein
MPQTLEPEPITAIIRARAAHVIRLGIPDVDDGLLEVIARNIAEQATRELVEAARDR